MAGGGVFGGVEVFASVWGTGGFFFGRTSSYAPLCLFFDKGVFGDPWEMLGRHLGDPWEFLGSLR